MVSGTNSPLLINWVAVFPSSVPSEIFFLNTSPVEM